MAATWALPFAFFMAQQSASLWLVVLNTTPLRCLAAGMMFYRNATGLVGAVRPAAGPAVRYVVVVVDAASRAWR